MQIERYKKCLDETEECFGRDEDMREAMKDIEYLKQYEDLRQALQKVEGSVTKKRRRKEKMKVWPINKDYCWKQAGREEKERQG